MQQHAGMLTSTLFSVLYSLCSDLLQVLLVESGPTFMYIPILFGGGTEKWKEKSFQKKPFFSTHGMYTVLCVNFTLVFLPIIHAPTFFWLDSFWTDVFSWNQYIYVCYFLHSFSVVFHLYITKPHCCRNESTWEWYDDLEHQTFPSRILEA